MSQDEVIREYIKQCYATYTREAITINLLKEGYAREDIEHGWELYLTQCSASVASKLPPSVNDEAQPHNSWHQGRLIPPLLGFALSVVLTVYLLLCDVYVGIGTANKNENIRTNIVFIASGINVLFLLAQIWLLVSILVSRTHRVSVGKAAKFVLTFDLVWFLLIGGSCLAALSLPYK